MEDRGANRGEWGHPAPSKAGSHCHRQAGRAKGESSVTAIQELGSSKREGAGAMGETPLLLEMHPEAERERNTPASFFL